MGFIPFFNYENYIGITLSPSLLGKSRESREGKKVNYFNLQLVTAFLKPRYYEFELQKKSPLWT